MPAAELNGVSVLVTRPEHQAKHLCDIIEAVGGEAIAFPVIAVGATSNPDALDAIIAALAEFHMAIFISANAVDFAMNRIRAADVEMPQHMRIAAVGRASAKALRRHGVTVDIRPQTQFNSEALLAEVELQNVAGKNIVIFRGEGGRELLAQSLIERGAKVSYAECYRRMQPVLDNAHLDALLKRWTRNEIDVVTVTSNEALRNLFDMLGGMGQKLLQKTPLIGVSERLLPVAKELGFLKPPRIAAQASDEALLEEVIQWHRRSES